VRAGRVATAPGREAEGTGRRSEPRSPLVAIRLGTAVVSLVFLAFLGWIALQTHHRAIAEAHASVRSIALLLEEHTGRTVETIDILLELGLRASERHRDEEDRARVRELLATLVAESAYVRRLTVIDLKTGRTLDKHNGSPDMVEPIEEEAFDIHAGNPALTLHIGRPYRDASDNGWVVGFSRRRALAHGEAVVVVAQVSLRKLQQLYDGIDVGRDGSIVLFRSDSTLLVRRPYLDANVGRQGGNSTLFKALLPSAPAGVYETSSWTDGVARIVAYRSLPNLPLIVVAAVGREEVLAGWWEETFRTFALVPFVLAVLVAFGTLMAREAKRRSDAELETREKTALLETTLDSMDQGLIMFDRSQTVQVCNRRAVELLELPPEMMARKPSFEELRRLQLNRNEFATSDESFRSWVAAGGLNLDRHTYERTRPNGTVLEVHTEPLPDGGAVRTFTDITARRQAHQRIAHMASHYALTDLPNRVLFRERLEAELARVRQEGRPLALLSFDLDLFKAVNDTLGHSVGDALLVAVADRVRLLLGSDDVLARLGGDEFAILQIGAEPVAGAAALAARVAQALGQPFRVAGHQVSIGASVGIAAAPGHGDTPDQLLRNADLALYRAKAEGRGSFRFFEPTMDREAQARRALELDLREAFLNREFELYYQPFAEIASGRIVGFEALLRWNHPRRGLIGPAEFVSVAEETGQIVALGEWVLRQACAEAARWPAGLRVAVNVSAMQVRQPNLVQTAVSALASAGLPAGRLELEITESVLMRNNEQSLRVLHQLRELGLRIAMDDFGTGYSSLSYLRSFPFDRLKIDRSFVGELHRSADCAAIVRAILGLAARLGIATTAEGVETPDQLAFMRAEGCTEAQGYLIGAPKPVQEVRALIAEGRLAA
jgi:diguanylate cyclase (GGDEF)-like protein